MGNKRKTRGINPQYKFRASANLEQDIAIGVSKLTQTYGRLVSPTDVIRFFVQTGLEAWRHCISCQTHTPCPTHPMLVIGADGEQSRPVPERTEGWTEVVKFYFETFEKTRGQSPPFAAVERTRMKKLITDVGKDRAIEAIRNAFGDPWWSKRVSIMQISKDPTRFLSGLRGPAPKKQSAVQRPAEDAAAFVPAPEVEA